MTLSAVLLAFAATLTSAQEVQLCVAKMQAARDVCCSDLPPSVMPCARPSMLPSECRGDCVSTFLDYAETCGIATDSVQSQIMPRFVTKPNCS